MNSSRANNLTARLHPDGFSLVEVTIAIGIFAFVVVGIMGLLPAGMRMRSDSAAETRGVLIAEELFASVRAAPNISNVIFRRGPGQQTGDNAWRDLSRDVFVMGYPNQTTVPYYWFYNNPESSWVNRGGTDPDIIASSVNAIETIARVSATNVPGLPGVYNVRVEVRSPASVPLDPSRVATFSTLVHFP